MAKIGDMVEVVLKDGKKYKGVLMPVAEVVGKGSIILKLDTGYNIGISEKRVKNVKLISVMPEAKKKKMKVEKKSELPNVSIISTGGTISCRVDYKSGGVYPSLSAEDLIEAAPEMTKFANYDFERVSQVYSEDLFVENWQAMAKAIYERIKAGRRGVIVTHGTDTLAISAAAISFMIQDLPVPVVFVGAQRSVDRGSSDSFPNLICAAAAATKWDGAESVVCMHENSNDDFNFLLRGNRARKMHTERRDAFRPINDFPLAKVDTYGEIVKKSEYRKRSKSEPKLFLRMEKKVALIHTYPGISPEVIDFYVRKGYKGIVIAGTGLGHVPIKLIPAIKKATGRGVPVIMTSQCLYGRVNAHVYERARTLEIKAKVIYCQDMLPETAFVKLMHVLGRSKKMDEVRELMLTNMAGEISEKSYHEAYLN